MSLCSASFMTILLQGASDFFSIFTHMGNKVDQIYWNQFMIEIFLDQKLLMIFSTPKDKNL